MLRKIAPAILLCAALLGEEFDIQLQNPLFSGGTISSSEGGIISGTDIRIQAKNISYTHKTENGIQVKNVHAAGNLLLEYQGKIFVGSELTYNLIDKKGMMKDGRTATDFWFVGGDEIELLPDGSFWISNAYLTSVESKNPWWQLHSSKIDVTNESLLSADNIKVRFFNIPIFWLPKFKFDLNMLKSSPIRYKFIWDQVLKQKISMRYQFYSTETFGLFGRLDYRFNKGPGVAIETDYQSLDKRFLFQTKSYGAYDKIVPDENSDKRYRFQGLLTSNWRDEKTKLYLGYDKLSDDKMPSDFHSDDFVIDTQQRTILWVSHFTDNTVSHFSLQPRINNFQSINQELPLITLGIRPLPIGKSGIIFQNTFSAGYLNYIYATGLADELPTSRSTRVETRNILYKRFKVGPVCFSPRIGFMGLHYSNTPQHHARGQAMGLYGFDLRTTLYKSFPTFLHKVQPYLVLQGLTTPTTPPKDHYIFSLEDGLARQTLFKPGISQSFYPTGSKFVPDITLDLYTNIFAGTTAFHRTLPKLYFTSEFQYPSWLISTDVVYNFQETLFDRANIRSAWTINEDAAFTLEFRHRSRFDWRKSDHNNYIVDIERPIDQLLASPLSDGRNTLLSKFQLRLSPLWTCHLESHIGTGRRNEPNYYAYQVRITTLLTGRWQVEFGYKYSPSTRQWIFPSVKLLNAKF